jgi:flagellar motor switch protein FliG
MQLTGREKATIFLSILGTETSSRILRYLPEELADLIASSVNHLPTPTPEALGEVFLDFQSFGALPPPPPPSKQVEAEAPRPKPAGTPLEVLENVPAQSFAFIMTGEDPRITAFILSALSQAKRDELLSALSSRRDEVSEMLGSLKKTPLAPVLEEKLIKHFAEKLR